MFACRLPLGTLVSNTLRSSHTISIFGCPHSPWSASSRLRRIALSLTVRDKEQIALNLIYSRLPGAFGFALQQLRTGVILLLGVVIVVYGWEAVSRMGGKYWERIGGDALRAPPAEPGGWRCARCLPAPTRGGRAFSRAECAMIRGARMRCPMGRRARECSEGCHDDDGCIAAAVRRVCTEVLDMGIERRCCNEPPAMSLSGAWWRLLPASPPDPSRPGGALRRGLLAALLWLPLLSFASMQAVALPVVRVAASAGTTEGGDAIFTLTASPAPMSALTVSVTVAAYGDYGIAGGDRTVTIPTDGSAVLTLATTDDDVDEPHGTVQLALHAGKGYTVGVLPGSYFCKLKQLEKVPCGEAHIWDDDGPEADPDPEIFFIASADDLPEGGTKAFDLDRGASPIGGSSVQIMFTINGTAVRGTDYTLTCGTVAGVECRLDPVAPYFPWIRIRTDQLPDPASTRIGRVLLLTATVDNIVETCGESVTLSAGMRTHPRAQTIKIVDAPSMETCDSPPTVSFASASQSVDEDSGTSDVTVSLSPAPATDITLSYTVDGTATAGADYTALSGTVSVSAGATTATVPVALVDDSVQEGSETVVLKLAAGSGYKVGSPDTHTLTIAASDPPTASFARASQSAGEDSGTSDVTVSLSPAPLADLTLAYTVGGTATAGSDYTALSGTVTAPAGATAATIPVTLIDDNVQEGSKTVVLELAAGSDYQVGSPDTHVLTVLDDETPPTVSFEPLEGRIVSARTSWVREGSGTHHLKVTLDKAPASALAVKYTVSGSAAAGADYVALSGTVTVPAGATTATIPVTIIDDDEREHAEEIALWLVTDGPAYHVARPSSHHLIIDPSDGGPWVSFAALSHAAGEGSGTHEVGVRLGPAPSTDVTFAYTVGGKATAGADYTALSGAVTVPAGATTAVIPVTLIDDGVQEGRETLALTLAGSAGYRVANPGTHTLSIVDDETPAVSFASASQSAGEGSGTSDVSVTLSPAPAAGLTLEYYVGGTATAARDFTIAGSGTLAVAAGATTAAIAVTVIDDNSYDGRETVVLTLIESGAAYQLGSPASHTLTIVDNETAPFSGPAVTIAAGTSPVTEGGSATFTLTATPPPAADLPVTVTVAADGDWGVTAGPRTVTIPTTGSATLTLATTGDDTDEPDGSVTATVTDGDGYTVGSAASGSVIIQDDDAPETTPDWTDYQTVVSYLIEVRDNPKNTAVKGNPVHIAKWNRVLEALGHDTGTGVAPMAASVIHANAAQWPDSPFKAASVYLKSQEQDPDEPAVTVSAGAASVTEGGDAVFTVTATPAPSADLAVSVTVATAGAYGISAGTRTVTVPTTGSATLTLATTDDAADEPDGSVSVTVTDGDGYTVGSAASGTVSVRDDDAAPGTPDWTDYQTVVSYLVEVRDNPKNTAVKDNPVHIAKWNRVLEAVGHDTGTGVAPMAASEIHANAAQWPDSPFKAASVYMKSQAQQQEPAVTVSAGASAVTEGGSATFTLTATPPPASPLAVSVAIATDGDYGITAGPRTVTIPTSGSATLTLATTDDGADEPDGSVTATVTDGSGYTVDDPASGSVTVRDDDEPPPDTPAVTLLAGSAVTEGASATFTLTADPAPAASLSVSVTVATAGDYGVTAGSQTVTIDTTGSATLTLATTGDTTDEPDGSVSVTVTDGSGYTVGDPASGTVAIRDDDVPAVTIAADAASVTEGGSASFTLTANPVPAAPLPVSVAVATDGDYGLTAGSRTVTLPTTGSATLTLTTADDATDEPDGSATVTVQTGTGYTVGTPASDTVAVRDDDLPPPVVTIAADAASVTEGGDAVFTLTADRAPAAALTVKLAVSETGVGDHVAAPDEGPATAVLPKDTTQAVFTLATVNDEADEPDGTVSVTVEPGAGYTVGAPASASVEVTDDDAPSAAPALSVGDSTAKEGARLPVMPFTVRLSPPAPGPVRVHVSTRPSAPVSAQPGRDYAPGSSALTFRAGETEKQVWILIYDDSHDEGAETFEVVLSEARGAAIGDGVAVGTIVNDDPMPAAWLARFGRTVAEQALDGIAHRMSAPRAPGMRGTLAGWALDVDAPAGGVPGAWSGAGPGAGDAAGGAPTLGGTGALALADIAHGFSGHSGPGGIDDGFGHDAGGFGASSPPPAQSLTMREALLGSSFTLTGERDASGGAAALWGRASRGSFDGAEGTFSLDGAATTALLGADYARGRWLIGVALAQSTGEGEYRDTKATPRPASQMCPEGAVGMDAELCRNAVRTGDGRVEASLTAALPYASVQASERLTLWGAAGYGSGEVTLETAMDGRYKADTTWRMAAAGLRGELLGAPAEASGPALAVTSDALWTRTSSEQTRDLAASDSDATRLRLGVEGSWRIALDGAGPSETEGAGRRAGGASLVPTLELGARHDGGDAETGFGLELGGGLAWSDPALGLTLDVSGRTLLAHENDALKDRGFAASLGFDPDPATERGPSLSLRQEFGARAGGGLDALFAPDPLEDRTGGEAASRWTMEAAYGLPAFGGRWTASPHAGLGLSAATRDYTLGWRWTPEAASTPDLAFGFRATRRESDTAAPEHTFGFEATARW